MAKSQDWIADLLAGYRKIQLAGEDLDQQNILNLAGGFTAVDDPTNGRTNVTATSAQYFVNVKDHGAVGDGSHDDTSAFLGALSALASNGTLFVPVGTYKLTSSFSFGTVLVKFDRGGILKPSAGAAITAPFIEAADTQQIVDLTAGGTFLVLNHQEIYAMWFGAKGDDTTDDTVAIQAALDSANASRQTVSALTYGELDSVATVILASGVHKLTAELGMNEFIAIKSNGHNCVLRQHTSTAAILRFGAYRNKIENIAFVGGKWHIVAYGPSAHYSAPLGSPTNGGPNWIEHCNFQYCSGPSFYMDTTATTAIPAGSYVPGRDESSATFHFHQCEFASPCFVYATADNIIYTQCDFLWDNLDGLSQPNDDNGNPLGAFNSGDHLTIVDCHGIPNNGVAQGAWMQGSGSFKADNFRFGGESTYVTMRFRGVMPYNGMPLHIGWGANELWIDRCAPTGNSGHDWLQIYDRMPGVIEVRGQEAGGSIDFGSTYGIWIDEVSLPISSYANSNVHDLRWSFLDVRGKSYDFERVYTSTAPATPGSFPNDPVNPTDVLPIIRKSINGYSPPPEPETRLNVYNTAIADFAGTWTAAFTNTAFGSTDTSSGHSITSAISSVDGGIAIWADPTAWGSGMPAGEYTLSFYARSDYGGRSQVVYTWGGGFANQTSLGIQDFSQSGKLERWAFHFWHDGTTTKKFAIATENIPNGKSIFIGLPMINKGCNVAPYVFPHVSGNNSTVEDKIRSVYYGSGLTAAPSAGTYAQGDVVFDDAPTAGMPSGYLCTAGGTPGTWIPIPNAAPAGNTPFSWYASGTQVGLLEQIGGSFYGLWLGDGNAFSPPNDYVLGSDNNTNTILNARSGGQIELRIGNVTIPMTITATAVQITGPSFNQLVSPDNYSDATTFHFRTLVGTTLATVTGDGSNNLVITPASKVTSVLGDGTQFDITPKDLTSPPTTPAVITKGFYYFNVNPGSTNAISFAVPTDRCYRLRADIILTTKAGGSHLAASARMVAECVINNENGTTTMGTATASSTNPASNVALEATTPITSDSGLNNGATPSQAAWTTDGVGNAILTIFNANLTNTAQASFYVEGFGAGS